MALPLLYLTLLTLSCYECRVCPSMDIRNSAGMLALLRDCHVVEGHVRILLMEYATESDFQSLQLREITQYLVFYRVQGLRSLGHVFPNLTLIGGHRLFQDYGLIVYEMPSLQEVGLPRLRRVVRGAVRIEKNPSKSE